MKARRVLAWSYGGGVQSTAIACLVAGGYLPRPEVIVMADTGREPAAVWNYLKHVAALISPSVIHIASHNLATVDLFSTKGRVLMPMYVDGGKGQLPTYCSVEWKRRVVRRWLRQRGIRACDLWLGISADEAHRAKDSDVLWIRHAYPLLDRKVRRADCAAIIERSGLPPAPRSSCWMCPYRGADEWALLPDDEFAKAQEVERTVKALDPRVSLLRNGLPLTRENATNKSPGVACDQGGFCWT